MSSGWTVFEVRPLICFFLPTCPLLTCGGNDHLDANNDYEEGSACAHVRASGLSQSRAECTQCYFLTTARSPLCSQYTRLRVKDTSQQTIINTKGSDNCCGSIMSSTIVDGKVTLQRYGYSMTLKRRCLTLKLNLQTFLLVYYSDDAAQDSTLLCNWLTIVCIWMRQNTFVKSTS